MDNKYHFYYDSNNKVICTTFYKGQIIKGISKCNPEDSFKVKTGEKLAYLRCRQKFLKKKMARAAAVYAKAYANAAKAERILQHAKDFVDDVTFEFSEVKNSLINFENSLQD